MPENQPEQGKINDANIDQQSKKTAGQRRINSLWEMTQTIMAISITFAMIYCGIKGINAPSINTAFVLVAAIYLVRTNHHRIGGSGSQTPNEER